MINRDKFSAKVMLFGEYSILLGSSALSIPLTTFNASFRKFPEMEHVITNQYSESNKILQTLCDHYLEESRIFSEFLDLDHFMEDIKTGLFLDSTIPQRYGVGSSGALCAAIYSRYAVDPVDPDGTVSNQDMLRLRDLFSRMESFFHGKSSGFDPLVIYFSIL
jgi:mevalonate kinase